MGDPEDARRKLVVLLQRAYSGELAAALAYAGHARSVRDPSERRSILRIQAEELAHRARLGALLASLDARPRRLLELRCRVVGRAIALFCFVAGWYLPMWGAARVERKNIREYEVAAALARSAGLLAFAGELLAMAATEREHERYFREKAERHAFARWLPPSVRRPVRSVRLHRSGGRRSRGIVTTPKRSSASWRASRWRPRPRP